MYISGNISPKVFELYSGLMGPSSSYAEKKPEESVEKGNRVEEKKGKESENAATANKELSEKEQKKLEYLKKRDREVRNHEQAHASAAGSLLKRGPVYKYEKGPDGKNYVVDGHVIIDTSREKNPSETIRKAERIARAATAPMEPSPSDLQLAAKARRMKMEAMQQLRSLKEEERQNGNDPSIANGDITLDDLMQEILPRQNFNNDVAISGTATGKLDSDSNRQVNILI